MDTIAFFFLFLFLVCFLKNSCLKQEVQMQHSMKGEQNLKTFGLYFFLPSRMFALSFNKDSGPRETSPD